MDEQQDDVSERTAMLIVWVGTVAFMVVFGSLFFGSFWYSVVVNPNAWVMIASCAIPLQLWRRERRGRGVTHEKGDDPAS